MDILQYRILYGTDGAAGWSASGHAAWRLPAQPPPIIPPLTRLIGGLHARHLTTGLEPAATTSHSLTHDGPLIRDTTVHERSHLRDLLGTTSKLTHTLTHSAPP